MTAHTVQLRDKLQALRVSPFDTRLHKGLAIGPGAGYTPPKEPRVS